MTTTRYLHRVWKGRRLGVTSTGPNEVTITATNTVGLLALGGSVVLSTSEAEHVAQALREFLDWRTLAEAVRRAGGQRRLARGSGIAQAKLSRALAGQISLSEADVATILRALPGLEAETIRLATQRWISVRNQALTSLAEADAALARLARGEIP